MIGILNDMDFIVLTFIFNYCAVVLHEFFTELPEKAIGFTENQQYSPMRGKVDEGLCKVGVEVAVFWYIDVIDASSGCLPGG